MQTKTNIFAAAFAFAAASTTFSFGDVCTSIASGDWSVSSNWNCGHPPTEGDTAIIDTGDTIDVKASADRVCENLEVKSGGLLRIYNSRILRVGDEFNADVDAAAIIDGTLAFVVDSSGTPNFRLRRFVDIVGDGVITARDTDGYGPGKITSDNVLAIITLVPTVGDTLELKGNISFEEDVNAASDRVEFQVDDADDTMTFGISSPELVFEGQGKLIVSAGLAQFANAELSTSSRRCQWSVQLSGGEVDIDANSAASDTLMTYTISGGTLDVNSAHKATSFSMSSGTAGFDAALTSSPFSISGGTLTLNAASTPTTLTVSGGTVDFNGAMSSGTATVSGGLLQFDAASTPTSISVSGGTVDFNAAMSSGNATVSSSGLLQFDAASSPTLITINGGTVDFNAALQSGNVTMTGGTLQFDAASTPSSGLFTLSGGTININQSLTGKDVEWSGGTFVIAASRIARFTGP